MLDLILILNYILRKNQLLSHMYLLTRLAFGYEGILGQWIKDHGID